MKRNKALAKEIHEAFLAACEECPSFRGFDDDQRELLRGEYVPVAKLYKKGVAAVIRYWRDPESIGGHIIHKSGYIACVPEDVVNLLDRITEIENKAIDAAMAGGE